LDEYMANGVQDIWSKIKKTASKRVGSFRFATLWVIFTLFTVLFPFVKGPLTSTIFLLLFSLLLISSVTAASGDRRILAVALAVLVTTIVLRLGFVLFGLTDLEALSFLFASFTLGLSAFLVFRSLFKIKNVTSDTIWQAISVYLLIGLTWGMFFSFVNLVSPGSFVDNTLPDQAISFPAMNYYSFVTLATLGYGDILPVTEAARSLAVMEVLTGVLYLAILISRLVGTWKPGEESK
jgi:hypothetical protein